MFEIEREKWLWELEEVLNAKNVSITCPVCGLKMKEDAFIDWD